MPSLWQPLLPKTHQERVVVPDFLGMFSSANFYDLPRQTEAGKDVQLLLLLWDL